MPSLATSRICEATSARTAARASADGWMRWSGMVRPLYFAAVPPRNPRARAGSARPLPHSFARCRRRRISAVPQAIGCGAASGARYARRARRPKSPGDGTAAAFAVIIAGGGETPVHDNETGVHDERLWHHQLRHGEGGARVAFAARRVAPLRRLQEGAAHARPAEGVVQRGRLADAAQSPRHDVEEAGAGGAGEASSTRRRPSP